MLKKLLVLTGILAMLFITACESDGDGGDDGNNEFRVISYFDGVNGEDYEFYYDGTKIDSAKYEHFETKEYIYANVEYSGDLPTEVTGYDAAGNKREKTEYNHTDGKLTEMIFYDEYYSGHWLEADRETYTWDGDKITSYTDYDYAEKGWQKEEEAFFTYTDGKITEVMEKWYGFMGAVDYDIKYDYIYVNGRIYQIVISQKINGSYEEESRKEYSLDENDRIIKVIISNKPNGVWDPHTNIEYTYGTNGMTEEIIQISSSKSKAFENHSRRVIHYDENGNYTGYDYYNWNNTWVMDISKGSEIEYEAGKGNYSTFHNMQMLPSYILMPQYENMPVITKIGSGNSKALNTYKKIAR